MDRMEQARQWLSAAKELAVLTGAGVSAESGIPTFRDDDTGYWSRFKPEDMASEAGYRRDPAHVWRWYQYRRERVAQVVPNAGHQALAHWARRHPQRMTLVTQNVDGLHQRSGVPESKIIELHGNSTYASCLDCGHRYALDPIRKAFLGEGRLPICEKCDGIVKTATISFGQAMPEIQMARAQDETMACDLFIVLGSSLVVYPAAGFPRVAKRKGARLVIVNRDPTDQDDDADLVVHAEIGPTLSRVVGVN